MRDAGWATLSLGTEVAFAFCRKQLGPGGSGSRGNSSRSIGNAHGSEKPRTVGHPAGGVVGFVSLGELELAIRVFANHKFRKERLGHPAMNTKVEPELVDSDTLCSHHFQFTTNRGAGGQSIGRRKSKTHSLHPVPKCRDRDRNGFGFAHHEWIRLCLPRMDSTSLTTRGRGTPKFNCFRPKANATSIPRERVGQPPLDLQGAAPTALWILLPSFPSPHGLG
jgi:hypothetical protein